MTRIAKGVPEGGLIFLAIDIQTEILANAVMESLSRKFLLYKLPYRRDVAGYIDYCTRVGCTLFPFVGGFEIFRLEVMFFDKIVKISPVFS